MTSSTLSLEDLATRTIAAGRVAANAILASDLASGHDRAFVERCLRRLVEGEPFDPRDEGGFATVQERLRREICKETTGTVRTFSGVRDPELGDFGDVVDRPVLTERGEALRSLSEWFDTFLRMRQQVLDRVQAEKFITAMWSR